MIDFENGSWARSQDTIMIYGIGIDIVEIQRMRDASEKWGNKFFEKFLTESEISYCFEKKDPYPSISVRWAAKEALIKAVGSEIHVNLKEVEVDNNRLGRPSLIIKGKLQEFFKEKGIESYHVSLSHEKAYGVASVVLEAGNE